MNDPKVSTMKKLSKFSIPRMKKNAEQNRSEFVVHTGKNTFCMLLIRYTDTFCDYVKLC